LRDSNVILERRNRWESDGESLTSAQGTLQNLDAEYVAQAEKDVAMQLSKAGVRLAYVLNEALK